MKQRIFLFGALMLMSFNAFPQGSGQKGEKPDPPYERNQLNQGKPVPYPSIREADVVYAKRIERVIDSREKKNLVMNWPKSALNKIIYDLVTTGEPTESGKLRVYRTDSLVNPLKIADAKKIGAKVVHYQIHNPKAPPEEIYDLIDVDTTEPFDPTQIKRWLLVEEWIFDKQRSMFFPRIIALAPLYQPELADVQLPEQPMFYINYSDLRPYLANEECFNRQNNAMRVTYSDFFDQRLFSSYITKESNDRDFAIKDFDAFKNNPMDALYESERIKNDMMNWESDLWEY
jgi:gliding motility associated protien GldN